MCGICLEELELNIECRECGSKICVECFRMLLDYCEKEKDIPRCCDCRENIMYSSMNGDLQERYSKVCMIYLLNNNQVKEELMRIKNQEGYIIKKQKERMLFISENYPKAIKKVIELAFEKKLKRMMLFNIKQLEKRLIYKKCMNQVCRTGVLLDYRIESIKCNLCDTVYCKRCENKKERDHECKESELESIKVMNEFVKCPKCLLPVVKSGGCNDMTCAICKTKFCYRTGEIAGGGNHTDTSITLKDDSEYKLSKLYYKSYSNVIIELMVQLEKLEPDIIKFDVIINALRKKGCGGSLQKLVSKKYEEYLKSKRENELYYKNLVKIQECIIKGDSENVLKDILQTKIVECERDFMGDIKRSVVLHQDPRYIEIYKRIKESYNDASILWMESISNNRLLERYKDIKGDVIELFHGTKEKNIDSIIESGFQNKYNVTSAYGKGTYMSPICKFSMDYTGKMDLFRYMFVCDCKIVGHEKKTESIYCFPRDKAILPKMLVVFKV